ncbi:tubulin monoglycylase TTLL3 isoform X1 [Conger conger]|uniref:tubulin monoglycylase TTLL3 isoform X1 n=1 Tax=Conger conger TaxID=82655 RepID=UPI002A59B3B0|nr:tubulin monoglycylase TTLL3 isoform X1 [Conger conger]
MPSQAPAPARTKQSLSIGEKLSSTDKSVPEVKARLGATNLPVITLDRLSKAKALVEKAVKQQKVFSVQGPYPVLRAALRARGWVEQRQPQNVASKGRTQENRSSSDDEDWLPSSCVFPDSSEEVERDDTPDDLYEIMSRLVRNEVVYFSWTMNRDTIDYRTLHKEQITNHFAKAGSFTTKVELCVNLRNLRWFDAADPDTFFPRCYRLGAADEKHAFIEDFRRSACSSLLQCVLERSRGEEVEEERAGLTDSSQSGQKKRCKRRAIESVGSGIIDSALHVCQDFLDALEHNDIDIAMETPPTLTEQQWAEFLHNYYMIVHEGVGIQDIHRYQEPCQVMLRKLREVSPQLDTDGIHNIWIVKPGALSRGRGIICVKRLEEILKLVNCNPALIKDSKWVVQKYLERPLLIHGTKFDLRQWFLVTDWNPMTIWFYRECYLRFSTQPYSVEKLDSSVHLCNNSIQKHFQPSEQRHPEIPEDNMWSSEQFRAFLRAGGQAALWDSVVVPGMKQAVVHALQTAQDLVESRPGSFELYGADFMLGRDLRPWLIEINGSPTMAPSTPVTAQLCMAVQEDILRVVLDRRLNRNACTGGFELIYKQAAVEIPQYTGVNLFVEGAPLRRPHIRPRRKLFLPKAINIPPLGTDQAKEGRVEKVIVAEKKTKEPTKKPVKTCQSSWQKPPAAPRCCPVAGKGRGSHTKKERKGPETAKGAPRQAGPPLRLIPVCPVLTAEPKAAKHSKLGPSSEERPHVPPRLLSRTTDSSLQGSVPRRPACHTCTTRSSLLSACGLPTMRSSASGRWSRSLQLGPLDGTTVTPQEPPPSDTSLLLPPALPNVQRQSTPKLREDMTSKSL